ncbi:MAG: 4Fe-4S binding protein [Candidatus Lokiarchaeota archaeon]|nr:4Fe-4S binding protein [Candidatus Lokiarchaeota archaeon]
MAFPARTKDFRPPATWTYTIKVLNHQRNLEYNGEKCVGCGLCIHACPMDGKVISWGTAPGERILVDVEKCVHCGVCAYFCPAGALKLFINGEERIELKEPADEIERHSLPDFKGETLAHKETGAPIRKYLRGSLHVPAGLDEAAKRAAVAACPTGALELAGDGLAVDEHKCFYCDACSRATGDRIQPRRTLLLVDMADGISPVVKRIIERLMDEQAAARIIKGVDQYKARDKAKALLEGVGSQ